MSFWKKILSYIWTPFNRDDLWCCSLTSDYCTYNPDKVKIGMVFCHVLDDTQKHRKDINTALKVIQKIDDRNYILRIPFLVSTNASGYTSVRPFKVTTIKDCYYNVGDFFEEYGQYYLDSIQCLNIDDGMSASHKSETVQRCKVLTQMNNRQEHVFDEPFIDFGNSDR